MLKIPQEGWPSSKDPVRLVRILTSTGDGRWEHSRVALYC